MLSWPFILGVIGGAVLTALRRPSLMATAAILDARGNTRDRLVSAREFSSKSNATAMERLAVDETSDWLAKHDLRPLTPIGFPRELRWIVIPLATLALLWWHELDRATQRDAEIADARESVSPTARSLEKMAEQVQHRAAQTNDAVLRRIAERLKQSAAQLRAEAERAGDTNTAALRQIADLEQLVKELRQPQGATPDELKTLSEALAQNEVTKDAADQMRENRLPEAAGALDRAAEKPEAQKAESALRQAVEHLARRKEQLSKQLQQLQEQAEQPGTERQQLLKDLAQMLREMPESNDKQKGKEGGKQAGRQHAQEGGEQMKDEDLKKLLSALQQLKDQQQGGAEQESSTGEPADDSREGSGPVTMLSFQSSPGAEPSGEIGVPRGQPGSEKDTGATKDPFAGEAGKQGEAQRKESLKGELAEGESLSVLVPSASAGEGKAARRYKELTEAAAAAAEDAVLQEEIPLGARFLIKRYFEAIRPRE
jgi:hypothetical protein